MSSQQQAALRTELLSFADKALGDIKQQLDMLGLYGHEKRRIYELVETTVNATLRGRIEWRPTEAELAKIIENHDPAVGNPADLRYADLGGKDLSGTQLLGARLEGSLLTNTNFVDANLSGANLSHAHAAGANFTRANLLNATFSGATLYDSSFTKANLSQARFDGADLTRACLLSANAEDTRFWETDLTVADLRDANLEDAIFGKANMSGTQLSEEYRDLPDYKEALPTKANTFTHPLKKESKIEHMLYGNNGVIRRGDILRLPYHSDLKVCDFHLSQMGTVAVLHDANTNKYVTTYTQDEISSAIDEGRIEHLSANNSRSSEQAAHQPKEPLAERIDRAKAASGTKAQTARDQSQTRAAKALGVNHAARSKNER